MKYCSGTFLLSALLLLGHAGSLTAQQDMSSPLDTNIRALAADKRSPASLYAGTDQALFLSQDDGRNWSATGLEGHAVKAVAVHPSDRSVLFVAAGEAGVFRSTDGGDQWQSLPVIQTAAAANRSGIADPGDIRSLAAYIDDGLVILAGSYKGYIFKSTDRGDTWTVINPDFPLPVLNALSVHPANPDLTYAASGARGILVSNNNTEWKSMNTGLINTTVTQVVIDPANPDTIYAGTYGGGIYRSVDAGRNWEPLNSGLASQYVLSLAVMSEATAGGGRSLFRNIGDGIKQLIFDPPASDVYAGVYGGGLFKFRGGSSDWLHIGAN